MSQAKPRYSLPAALTLWSPPSPCLPVYPRKPFLSDLIKFGSYWLLLPCAAYIFQATASSSYMDDAEGDYNCGLPTPVAGLALAGQFAFLLVSPERLTGLRAGAFPRSSAAGVLRLCCSRGRPVLQPPGCGRHHPRSCGVLDGPRRAGGIWGL